MSYLLRHTAATAKLKLDRASAIRRLSTEPVDTRRALLYADLFLPFRKRLRPAHAYPIELRRGEPPVYLSGKDLTIDRVALFEIFLHRCYATDYEDAVVVDVGAHKGYYGAYSLLRGARTVLSYEPEGRNFDFLERTASSFRSAGRDWQVHKAAAGSRSGEVELQVSEESFAHSVLRLPSSGRRQAVATERVPVIAMDDVLKAAASFSGRRFIVKVDAEGAECDIILPTPVEAWRGVDELFVEVHSFAPCGAEEIVAHLAGAELVLRATAQSLETQILTLSRS